jgi:hypothetical protein
MRFKMFVRNQGTSKEWAEDYNKPEIGSLSEAEEFGRTTVGNFNSSLRPHEQPRELVRVESDERGDSNASHSWEKTSLVTQMGPRGSYDAMRCKQCGVTGKRFGVDGVKLDSQYRAKAFRKCDTAMRLLGRRKERLRG